MLVDRARRLPSRTRFGVEALRFLRDTAEAGGLTPRFLRELSRFVQRSRNNPELRLEDGR